jgi:hypothetical protein
MRCAEHPRIQTSTDLVDVLIEAECMASKRDWPLRNTSKASTIRRGVELAREACRTRNCGAIDRQV